MLSRFRITMSDLEWETRAWWKARAALQWPAVCFATAGRLAARRRFDVKGASRPGHAGSFA